MFIDLLSTYPTAKKLSELKITKWLKLGIQLGLTEDELKILKKSAHPTAQAILIAKVKNIDINWEYIIEHLLVVGENKVAQFVCAQNG